MQGCFDEFIALDKVEAFQEDSTQKGEDLSGWHIYLGFVVGVIFLEFAIICTAIIVPMV